MKKKGIMESWNDGIMDKQQFGRPISGSFHHFSIPIGLLFGLRVLCSDLPCIGKPKPGEMKNQRGGFSRDPRFSASDDSGVHLVDLIFFITHDSKLLQGEN